VRHLLFGRLLKLNQKPGLRQGPVPEYGILVAEDMTVV
jgi:hypothetical protein